MDDLVGEVDPLTLGQDAHEFLFDLLWGVAFGEIEAVRDTEDMGVNDYAFR